VPPGAGDVTVLLRRWHTGDREAEAELFELVLPDLRRLARYSTLRERPGHTLQPSDLLNEVYVRLVGCQNQNWQDRRHFFAISARAMRRYLIDYARGRPRAKLVPLGDLDIPAIPASQRDLAIAIDRLLEDLAREDPEACSIVELKFFLGLTDDEASAALNIPVRSLQRRWQTAREWLFRRLETHQWKKDSSETTFS
jgi:RNA polymerase sigma factor (TIGR02999 family)